MQNQHEKLEDYQKLLEDSFDDMREISSGGGGIIIKAHHKGLDKEVIIKKIIRSKVNVIDKTAERNVLTKLKHPYLPQIYDYIERGDDVFTVMEYIPGQNFAQIMEEGKRKFTNKELLKWTQQLCDVVEYLHTRKPAIIHCDIKPANIMLTPENNICLIDFNISSLDTDEGLSVVGYTPGYAPAEQFYLVTSRRIKKKNTASSDNNAVIKPEVSDSDITKADTDLTHVDTDVTSLDVAGCVPAQSGKNNSESINGVDDSTAIDENDTVSDGAETTPTDDRTAVDTESTQKDFNVKNGAEKYAAKKKKTNTSKKNEYTEMTRDQILSLVQREGIQPQIDARTDIYSVGATLYHLASGVKPGPFYSKGKSIQELCPGLPDGLSYLIIKSMALKPQDRFRDSSEMRKTAMSIYKFDRRYKRLNRLETASVFFSCALLIGSVVLSRYGMGLMDGEKNDHYNELIGQMEEAREAGDIDTFEQLYVEAVDFLPDEIPAYYEKAYALYQNMEYGNCIEYIYDNVLLDETLKNIDGIDTFYYLSASSCFELGDYDGAVEYFAKALEAKPLEISYNRDYILALARQGNTVEARKELDKVKDYGLMTDTLLLLEGEISYMEGDFSTALSSLTECINNTDDEDVLMRAACKLDDVYELQAGNTDCCTKRVAVLEQACEKLSDQKQIILMERLAQAYMDLADAIEAQTDKNKYNIKAIDTLNSIRENGYGTFRTDYNIALLYSKSEQYDKAEAWDKKMLQDRGESYTWYMWLAINELWRQEKLPNEERSYSEFYDYYDLATELYKNSKDKDDNGMMQFLDVKYRDVVDGGWAR